MNIVVFFIAAAILLFGFWLFGLAFTVTVFQLPIFLAGILCVALAYAIPVNILRD
ncbi:MAG TPA: hypothetical protein VEX88_06700 [Glaciibacter sp.]|jgi:hypothetical protein|nr:hypothetical protein [Glaciibacter sp.]